MKFSRKLKYIEFELLLIQIASFVFQMFCLDKTIEIC